MFTIVSRRIRLFSSLLHGTQISRTRVMVSRISQRLVHHHHTTTLSLRIERLLLLEPLLNIRAVWHKTRIVLASLGVVDTERNELPTVVALVELVLLTLFGVGNDALELHALGERAVGVAAVYRVEERLEVGFDRRFVGLCRSDACCCSGRSCVCCARFRLGALFVRLGFDLGFER